MTHPRQITIAGWDIGQAKPGDGKQIADLFRTIPSAEVLQQTIWSSPSADAYVEDLIAGSFSGMTMDFYVIRNGNRIGGAIAKRSIENRVFFDNCVVQPEIRANQLALPFMTTTIRMTTPDVSSPELAFDVDVANRALLILYRRARAVTQYVQYWHKGKMRPQGSQRAGIIHQDPASIANHQRYGFSLLDVETSQSRYKVGKLADHGYRLSDHTGWADRELLAALYSDGPERTVYIQSPHCESPEGSESLVGYVRLHANRDLYLRGLESQIAKHRRIA